MHDRRHVIARRDGWRCNFCGRFTLCATCLPDVPTEGTATVDHIVPKAQGGTDALANLCMRALQSGEGRRCVAVPNRTPPVRPATRRATHAGPGAAAGKQPVHPQNRRAEACVMRSAFDEIKVAQP